LPAGLFTQDEDVIEAILEVLPIQVIPAHTGLITCFF
jgi:hypothetical protein